MAAINDNVFTAQEIENIMNASLDYYMRGPAMAQTLQDRPTLREMKAKQKTFPGSQGSIKGNVKADYTTSFVGYSGDDVVEYSNPANLKQFSYEWFELHAGISVSFSELKSNGISVVDSATGDSTRNHSGNAMQVITNIMEDKLDDMAEGSARSFNDILWRDGTQSAKVFPGIQSIITDDPTTGVVGGIDRASNSWWRNRALTGGSKITASASAQTLTKTLRAEARQLKRFGGKPSIIRCGSDFIEALELEVHEKGNYTESGFRNNGATDIGMADISMRGVGSFVYDPTLDDLGLDKFAYFIDPRHIQLHVMAGEDMKRHNPARPHDQYVMYRGVTWTGTLCAKKMNSHGLYEVA